MAAIACRCHVHDHLPAALLDSARSPESSRPACRDPGSPPSASRIATIEKQPPTSPEICRPTSVGLALTTLERLAIVPNDRQTGNGDRLASTRISAVLELEESSSTGSTFTVGGSNHPHSQDEPGQSPLGSPTHSWGTVEAGI